MAEVIPVRREDQSVGSGKSAAGSRPSRPRVNYKSSAQTPFLIIELSLHLFPPFFLDNSLIYDNIYVIQWLVAMDLASAVGSRATSLLAVSSRYILSTVASSKVKGGSKTAKSLESTRWTMTTKPSQLTLWGDSQGSSTQKSGSTTLPEEVSTRRAQAASSQYQARDLASMCTRAADNA